MNLVNFTYNTLSPYHSSTPLLILSSLLRMYHLPFTLPLSEPSLDMFIVQDDDIPYSEVSTI